MYSTHNLVCILVENQIQIKKWSVVCLLHKMFSVTVLQWLLSQCKLCVM